MITSTSALPGILQCFNKEFRSVVPFNIEANRLLLMNFTATNTTLKQETVNETSAFCEYIDKQLYDAGADYGIGGYDEHRTVYARSEVFDDAGEPRRLHIGIDIWGAAATPVYAPLDGKVHSVGNNNRFGDYGATIVLQHQLDGLVFHTLYGHLSLKSIAALIPDQMIAAGSAIADFGIPSENGQWPPHLHFQVIEDMEGMRGDYPGVSKFSERGKYLANCPDPDLILNMMQYAV